MAKSEVVGSGRPRFETVAEFADFLKEQRDKLMSFLGDGKNGRVWVGDMSNNLPVVGPGRSVLLRKRVEVTDHEETLKGAMREAFGEPRMVTPEDVASGNKVNFSADFIHGTDFLVLHLGAITSLRAALDAIEASPGMDTLMVRQESPEVRRVDAPVASMLGIVRESRINHARELESPAMFLRGASDMSVQSGLGSLAGLDAESEYYIFDGPAPWNPDLEEGRLAVEQEVLRQRNRMVRAFARAPRSEEYVRY